MVMMPSRDDNKCPIWGTPAQFTPAMSHFDNIIDLPRTSGSYMISMIMPRFLIRSKFV